MPVPRLLSGDSSSTYLPHPSRSAVDSGGHGTLQSAKSSFIVSAGSPTAAGSAELVAFRGQGTQATERQGGRVAGWATQSFGGLDGGAAFSGPRFEGAAKQAASSRAVMSLEEPREGYDAWVSDGSRCSSDSDAESCRASLSRAQSRARNDSQRIGLTKREGGGAASVAPCAGAEATAALWRGAEGTAALWGGAEGRSRKRGKHRERSERELQRSDSWGILEVNAAVRRPWP